MPSVMFLENYKIEMLVEKRKKKRDIMNLNLANKLITNVEK